MGYVTDKDTLFDHDYSFSGEVLAPVSLHHYEATGRSYIANIPFNQIVGVSNGNYFNLSWGSILRERRLQHPMRTLEGLAENPSYYLDSQPKQGLNAAKIGGRYYITGGVHRMIIGRAFMEYNDLPAELRGVHVTEYVKPNLKVEDIFGEPEKPKQNFNWVWVAVAAIAAYLLLT